MRRILIFLICIFAFGSLGILRHFAGDAPSVFLAFSRIVISLAIFLFLYRNSIKMPTNWKVWASFAISGFVIATAFTLYMEAYKYANVSDVALLGFVDPLFVTVLAAWFLREKVGKLDFVALALAAIGIFFLMNRNVEKASADIGIVLATLAFAAGAANTILARWEEKHRAPLSEVLIFPFAFAAAYLSIPAMHSLDTTNMTQGNWLAILGLGICTATAYSSYDYLMIKWGAHITELSTRAGITVVATILSVVLLGEKLGDGWGIAAVFLFGAACVLYFEAKREKKELHHHTSHAH